MKIEIEFDEKEFEFLIKEEWYKRGRKTAAYRMREMMDTKIYQFIKDHEYEFTEILKESMQSVLKEFTIKDLKQYQKSIFEKAKKKRLVKK